MANDISISASSQAYSLHSRLEPVASDDNLSKGISSRPEQKASETNHNSTLVLSSGRGASLDTYSHLAQDLQATQAAGNSIRDSLKHLVSMSTQVDSYVATQSSSLEGSADARSKVSGRALELSVQTRDGDSIHIEISRESKTSLDGGAYVRQMESTYSIVTEGELDEEERTALALLLGKLGQLSDEYLSEGWVKLGDLAAFDGDALSSFDLNVKGLNEGSFSLAFSIDEFANERSLSANLNDYEYTVSSALSGLYLDKSLEDNDEYLRLRDLIRDTALDYQASEAAEGKSSQDIASFFLEGLDALFNVQVAEDERSDSTSQAEGKQGSESALVSQSMDRNLGQKDGLLDVFSTGLPDYSAEFKTAVLRPNANNPSEVSMMSLQLSQKTELTSEVGEGGKLSTIRQLSEYSSRISQHLQVVPGDSEDAGASYIYRSDVESGSWMRGLNILNDARPVSVDEVRRHEHTRTDKVVEEGFEKEKIVQDLSRASENYERSRDLPALPADKNLSVIELLDYLDLDHDQDHD